MADEKPPVAHPVAFPVMMAQAGRAVPSVYASGLSVKVGHSDVSLLFFHEEFQIGGMPGAGPTTTVQYAPDVQVSMSVVTAKVLAKWLSATVAAYEQEFGPVRIPEASLPIETTLKNMIAAIKNIKMAE